MLGRVKKTEFAGQGKKEKKLVPRGFIVASPKFLLRRFMVGKCIVLVRF
jgi:hypothetical protein